MATTYSFTLLILKTAILIEWVRIFIPRGQRTVLYWTSVIVLLVNAGMYLSFIFVIFGSCQPFEKTWHFWLAGRCINKKSRDIVAASLNLVTDVFILLLPQGVIWKLHMTRRRRVGVSIVFSVGILYVHAILPPLKRYLLNLPPSQSHCPRCWPAVLHCHA